jgi:hypothetical protein
MLQIQSLGAEKSKPLFGGYTHFGLNSAGEALATKNTSFATAL